MWLALVGLFACGDDAANGPPPVVLQSIDITPTVPAVAAGTSMQLTATGRYSDATTMDLTKLVAWSSSAATTATVSTTGVFLGVALGEATITATLNAVTGTAHVTVTAAKLTEIQVTPTNPSLAAGTIRQLTAMGIFTDSSKQDLTSQVTWSSDSVAHVTVSAAGLAKAIAKGTATITAAMGAVSGTTMLTATDATLVSLAITPMPASVALGRKLQLTATGTFTDATTQNLTAQVTWASAAAGTATIDIAGLVTTHAVGTSTITAGFSGVTGMTDLSVTDAVLDSIAVTPTSPSVAAGRTRQLTATGTFSDATTQILTDQVTWTSSDDTVAKLSNAAGSHGLATTLKAGTATVTATVTTPAGPITGSTTLTVTDAVLDSIAITPPTPSVAKGHKKQLTATGTFSDQTTQNLTTQVTWTSSDSAIAQVSNADPTQGLATTIAEGTVTVSAALTTPEGTVTGSTELTVTAAVIDSIEVTPSTPSVAAGLKQQFVAMATLSDRTVEDVTKQVTWASDNIAVATISGAAGSEGLASTIKIGAAVISATSGTVTGSTTLNVTAAVVASIQVTPVNPSISLGTTVQFTAIGTFSDATTKDLTTQALWASTATDVASISNDPVSVGEALAVAVGSTTISASFNGKTGSTLLTVTDAVVVSIQVTPVDSSLPAGLTQPYTAIGTFSDQTTQNLTTQATWSTGDIAVATISNAAGSHGVAAAVAKGSTSISASFGGKTGSTLLTVTDAVLARIEVTPTNPSLALGRTLAFTATGVFSNLSTQNLTSTVSWASSLDTVATVSNAPTEQGLATSHATGATSISATLNGITGASLLTVTPAVLDSIAVTPDAPSLAKGRSLQFIATGTFSDLTHQTLTDQVTWSSELITVTQISSTGNATAVGVGQTKITATDALTGISGSTQLTVTAAALDSIAVTPAAPSVAKGRPQQFTAIGTFSDTTTQDLTAQVAWASTNTTVAQISNAPSSAGLATTLAVGSTTITATLQGVPGSALLTVTPAVLDSIAVTPATASILVGGTQQFVATGTFSDTTTQTLTTTVTWASAPQTIAQVSNASPTQGLATGVAAGTATITATSGTVVSNSATLAVSLPTAVATALPRDATVGNSLATPIVVTFTQAIAAASLTTQTATGACSGSLQLSADSFTTCVGFAAAPTMSSGNTVATATPVAALLAQTTYQIRVLGSVTSAAGFPIGSDFTQPTGFATGNGATCASGLVISQVYGAGGNGGNGNSSFHNDFIELHNAGPTPVALAGLAVQYAAANGTSWQVTALPPAVTLPPGGYYLIQEGAGTGTAPALPTPDLMATPAIAMAANAGKVALTASTTALTGACPLGLTLDFVGYGTTATCFEGTGPTGAPGNITAALRNGGGCNETNANSVDFAVSTPTPRNGLTAANVCSCP